MKQRFWKWMDLAGDDGGPPSRELLLEGTIAEESWFDDDVTAEAFRDELNGGSGDVTIWINSPGGDCIAASRIYTMLMEYPGHVTVKIPGLAASAASVVAMAGERVLMSPTAMMMVHNPATVVFGNHREMSKAMEVLDEVKESIINAYEIKTGMSRAKIARLMDDETWMNARKAVELGFADGLLSGTPMPGSEDGPDEGDGTFAARGQMRRLVALLSADAGEGRGRQVSADDLMARLELIRR